MRRSFAAHCIGLWALWQMNRARNFYTRNPLLFVLFFVFISEMKDNTKSFFVLYTPHPFPQAEVFYMHHENRIAEVLDEYVEDMAAGRLPKVYHRMAEAIGVDVESLLELMPLFEMVTYIHLISGRTSSSPSQNSSKRNGDSKKPFFPG